MSLSEANFFVAGFDVTLGWRMFSVVAATATKCSGKGPSLRAGANSRPTPSGFMMNAPNSPGLLSGLMSGTSPTHFAPFQTMPGLVGSHGFPLASAEARLYMMRRFAGQEKPQFGNIPNPVGSAVERRWALLPASV